MLLWKVGGRFKDTLRKHFRYCESDGLRTTIKQAIYYFNYERPVRKLNGKPPVPYRTGGIEDLCLLTIDYSSELDAKQFPYGIGAEYDGGKVDDDLEIVTIQAHLCGVYKQRQNVRCFVETCHRLVTEFFPQSAQYEYAENIEFEVYSSDDVSNPDYQCEIWIAVKEKRSNEISNVIRYY